MIFPDRFQTWEPDNGGEHLAFVTQKLRLMHRDWVPREPLFITNLEIIAKANSALAEALKQKEERNQKM